MKSELEIRSFVENLAERFKIQQPLVVCHWRGSGRANAKIVLSNPPSTTLSIPFHSWTGLEQMICHEVSHLIEWSRYGFPLPHRPHAVPFTKVLQEVAKYVLTEFGFTYDFSIEYPQISKIAGVATMPYGRVRLEHKFKQLAKLAGLTPEQIIQLTEGMK